MVTPFDINTIYSQILDFLGQPVSSGSKITVGLLIVIALYIYILSKRK